MIKKYSFVLIVFLCAFFYGFGQTKIAELTFETAGGYTTSSSEFVGASDADYFTRTDGSNITSSASFNNIQGSYYFAAQDTDANIGLPINLTLDISNINISGYTSLEFRIHIAEDDDGSAEDWDGNTYLHISGSIDSGTSQNLIWVESSSSSSNFPPFIDTDFDLTGDGTEITDTFTQFTNSITGTGSLLDIQIEFNNLRYGDEDIAIDNIEIWGIVSCTDTVDFNNIQFPASGAISVGGVFDVFAQAYEPGITNDGDAPSDAGTGIEAWIGFNTSNTDPSTWAETDWIVATYNTDDGNNDEYTIDLGAQISTTGTYYYASRFRLNSCGFTYGGFDSGGGDGFWDGTNDVNGVLTVNPRVLDFVNLQHPEMGSISVGQTYDVFAQVYEPGVTDTPGAQGANIEAWIGYSTADNDPSISGGWTWIAANYNPLCGANCGTPENNDEYFIDIGSSLPAGTYYYASRFRIDSGAYNYGGILADGSAGNQWDGSTYISGILTIIDPNPPTCNFSDDFNRVDSSTIGGGWAEIGNDASILSNELSITTGSATGLDYVYQDVSGSYTTQLDASTDIVTWEFNMRQSRTNPSGFASGNYGVGFVIGGTNSNITSGNGYAVVLGQSGTTDNVRLVSYSGGISNQTNIITGNSDYGNDYLSIKVVFDPVTNTWELFVRDDGTVFTSPSTLDVIDSEGTAINSTFTNSNLDFIAAIWNHATGATETATFDNICVSIETVCVPTHSITSFTPTSGPENTEVTITGTGFTISTSVTFNGSAATIISQTSTEIIILAPSGASTGVITVTESLCGIETNSDFTIIDSVNYGCQGTVSTTELFISEITDATSGSLSYIEIFNGTGSTVDLSDYTIEIRYNSGNTKDDFTMSGSLIDGGIHVISTNVDTPCVVTGGDGSLNDEASTMSGVNTPKNGADCISLFKNYTNAANPGTLIDIWGDCSDKNWRENLGVAIGNEGFDFRRLATASPIPNTTFTLADWNIIDWEDDTCADDDYSDIGSYTPGLTPVVTLNPNALSSCELTAELTVAGSEGFNDSGDTQELTYQWYYSAPGDTGWTIVTDGVLYTGGTSTMLSISNVLNTLEYQFYCQIQEDDTTCYQATNATKLDVESTTWYDNAGTIEWSNGAPDINTIAVIDEDYDTTTSGNIEACNLIINAGNQLDVRNSTYVKIQHNVIVDGSIVVQTQGAFVQVDDDGTFTVNTGGSSSVIKQTANLDAWYEYTYWSSPVINQTVENAFPNTPSNRRFWYNAQNYLDQTREVGNNNNTNPGQDDIDDGAPWDWQIASGIMTEGLGYAATSSTLGMFPRTDQSTFIGAFHTGDINVSVYKNDLEANDNNWNLIGNPYPSAIDADLFLTENMSIIDETTPVNPPLGGVSEGAIFFWSQDSSPSNNNNGNQNENFAQSDYAIINLATEVAGGDGVTPTRNIPSGQAFFIAYDHAAAGTEISMGSDIKEGIIKFTNSMRQADTNSNDLFFRGNSNSVNKLWLNLTSDNGVFNQMAIAYVDGATNNYDGFAYDAPRNLSSDVYSSIYSLIEGEDMKFVIQGKDTNSLDLTEVIPLGFDTSINVATLYTLSIPQFEGDFFTNNPIYVKDNLMNITHDLSASDYSFTSEIGEFKERFEIVFTQEALSLDDNEAYTDSLSIIEHDNGRVQFKLSSPLEMKTIKIVDLLGRTIYQLQASGNSITYDLSNLSQATYIAKVELSNGNVIIKKAVKRK